MVDDVTSSLTSTITCKRGSASVVRTSVVTMGKGKLCTSSDPKLRYQSTPVCERIMKSVKWRELQNLVHIGFTGASPHVGEMYTFTVCSSCFVDKATDHNSQRILMYYGLKDFVWREDVPFEYPKSQCKGVKIPKIWTSRAIPAKRKLSELLYNFVNKQNTPIAVMKHLLEIAFALSA